MVLSVPSGIWPAKATVSLLLAKIRRWPKASTCNINKRPGRINTYPNSRINCLGILLILDPPSRSGSSMCLALYDKEPAVFWHVVVHCHGIRPKGSIRVVPMDVGDMKLGPDQNINMSSKAISSNANVLTLIVVILK